MGVGKGKRHVRKLKAMSITYAQQITKVVALGFWQLWTWRYELFFWILFVNIFSFFFSFLIDFIPFIDSKLCSNYLLISAISIFFFVWPGHSSHSIILFLRDGAIRKEIQRIVQEKRNATCEIYLSRYKLLSFNFLNFYFGFTLSIQKQKINVALKLETCLNLLKNYLGCPW